MTSVKISKEFKKDEEEELKKDFMDNFKTLRMEERVKDSKAGIMIFITSDIKDTKVEDGIVHDVTSANSVLNYGSLNHILVMHKEALKVLVKSSEMIMQELEKEKEKEK